MGGSAEGLVWYKDEPSYFIINKLTEPIMTQTHPQAMLHELPSDLCSTEPYYYRELDMNATKMGELVKDHKDNQEGTFDYKARGYKMLERDEANGIVDSKQTVRGKTRLKDEMIEQRVQDMTVD